MLAKRWVHLCPVHCVICCSACPLLFRNTNAIDKAQLSSPHSTYYDSSSIASISQMLCTVWIRNCLSETKKSLQAVIHPPVNRTANSTADPPPEIRQRRHSRHKLNGLVVPVGSICSKRAKAAPYSTDLTHAKRPVANKVCLHMQACVCSES
ncbi:hypothetical protein GGI42DRAFT_207728 [Trichoderma sp. SZMC 28013]